VSQVAKGCLVLYKDRPALVTEANKKLSIRLADGETLSVRPKDVQLLHPGPLHTLPNFSEAPGDPLTAWELLAGQTTSLPELADLIFGDYTPQTAWATQLLIADGLYFSGYTNQIKVHDVQTVADITAAREAKAAEAAAWQAFCDRLARGERDPADDHYYAEIEDVALDRALQSPVLKQLGRAENPESAHAFLLETGVWTATNDPYPYRAGLPLHSPMEIISSLLEEERLDLTHLTSLAIDDEGSQDPDDALALDGDRIWVHIADAAALVMPDSPLDMTARERAANLYLPTGTSGMLPDSITDSLALGLTEVSPALSFGFYLDEDATIQDLLITPSWVKVQRLSYEAAEPLMAESPLKELAAAADRFQARREVNGAVNIDLPETKVRVGNDGRVELRPLPSLRSRDTVREAMLMVGEAVAMYCSENDIPVAYSTQPPPWPQDEIPEGVAGMFARRRGMQRSVYRTNPEPHAGLGLDRYVQATSPLRRYLDLVAHQQIRAAITGSTPLSEKDILLRIGAIESTTQAIRTTERQSNRHWTMVYLLQNPDWQGEGIIVEKYQGRYKSIIPELALETEVYSRQPRQLNEVIQLAVASIDLPTLSPRFRMISEPSA